MKKYDVVIIGSGTSGQTAAYEMVKQGLKIAVIEKSDQAGGTCALRGCQAKKWFYEGAELAAKSHHLKGKGILKEPQTSWSDFLKAKNRFTDSVPENTISGLKKKGIDIIHGEAEFQDDKTLTADGQVISADHFVVAVGARPRPLKMEGAEYLTTSRQFLELAHLPLRIVFIGGGFISFEFAHFVTHICRNKSRQTTILQAGPRPLKPFDAGMVSLLSTASEDAGIRIYNNVQITAIEKTNQEFSVYTKDGRIFKADLVVHGAGRTADIETLGLDKADIDFSNKGILTNEKMQTTNPRVFAVGDCSQTLKLARIADYEALIAANTIMDNGSDGTHLNPIDYHSVPVVLFTYPQLAMVGKTEEQLKNKGTSYITSTDQNLDWPTYKRIGMTHAAYKILMDEDGMLIGAHLLSDHATGMINTICMAMRNRISAEALYYQCMISPYPSRESDLIYMLKPLLGKTAFRKCGQKMNENRER
jgi:glutathione reductase (NADPH)